jgi:hypothetical protein
LYFSSSSTYVALGFFIPTIGKMATDKDDTTMSDFPPHKPPERRMSNQSDWAQRFGPSSYEFIQNAFNDGHYHSGLAPEFPAPLVAEQDVWPEGAVDKPNNAELDRLFFSERIQTERLCGLKSWQLADVTKTFETFPQEDVYDDSGLRVGKQSLPHNITIDRAKWMNLFNESKWLDLDTVSFMDTIQNPPDGWKQLKPVRWSIDNDLLSPHLEVAMEVVNRIFLTMVNDRDQWQVYVGFGQHLTEFANCSPRVLGLTLSSLERSKA